MSDVTRNFIITVSLIVVSMMAGYLLRRTRFPVEKAAEWIMTAVGVGGYSLVGFLTIWQLKPDIAAFWLPVMAAAHTVILCAIGLVVSRRLLKQPTLRGLLAISAGAGNNGFTMGGFIIYLLLGEVGLGLVTMYGLVWTPLTALVFYPIARHYTHDGPPQSLSKLMLKSVLDWRSIGLPLTLAGLGLSYANVPRPAFVTSYHVIDALIFAITPLAYFAIGLQLHVSDITSSRRIIAALAGLRFLAGPLVGLMLVCVTYLTPWPMGKIDQRVFIIESFVPTAVTMVAVANMFRLEPRKASMLFIVNTVMYLVLVLPITLWLFGQ